MNVAELQVSRSSLSRDTFFSAISFGSNGLLLLLVVFAARYLGVEDFGKYCGALALVTLFDVLSDLGMRTFLAKEVARNQELANSYFSSLVPIKIVLGLLTVLVVVSTTLLMNYSRELMLVVYILAVAMILRSFKFTIRAFFQAFRKFEYEAASLVFERILTLAVGLFVLWSGYGLVAFALVFPLVRSIDLVVTMIVFKREITQPKIRIDLGKWREMIIGALPFGLALGLGSLYLRLDTVMLAKMRPAFEVGWYGAGYSFIDACYMIPAVLSASLLPTLSILHVRSKDEFQAVCGRVLKYLVIIALGVGTVGVLSGDRLIALVYGEQYAESGVILKILCSALLFSYLASLGGTMLYSMDREVHVLRNMLFSVAMNFILNLILIDKYGYIGAAFATAITQLGYCCLNFFTLYQTGYGRFRFRGVFWRAALASAVFGAIISGLTDFPFVLTLVGGGMSYIASLIVLRTFDDTDWKAFGRLPATVFGR